jgi:septal ring-binding cell division protein DamX/type II secretory pathway predicted ATPase ExeA
MNHYTDGLKLKFDPFTLDGASADFYRGSNWPQLLDQLIQISYYSSDIAIVTGPLGSGKSTLAHHLKQSLGDEFVIAPVQASLFMDQLQLLDSIGTALGIETAGYSTVADLKNALANFINMMTDQSKSVQLIIDDAHELGVDALLGLVDLVAQQDEAAVLGEGGVNVALFAEPQILNSVSHLPPDSRTAFTLEPLSQDEAIDYIRSKLASAGYSGRFPMTSEEVARAWTQSRGNPATLNSLVADALSEQEFIPSALPNLHFTERNLVAASGVFALALFGLFIFIGGNEEPSIDDNVAQSNSSPINRIQIPVEVTTDSTVDAQAVEPESPTQELVIDDSALALIDEPELVAEVLVDDSPAPVQTDVASTDSADSPIAAVREEVIVVDEVDTMSDIEEPIVVEVEAEEAPVETAISQVAAAPQHKLLSLPSNNFTLQLLGSRSENNVRNFIAQNSNDDNISYFETRFQEKPWYVVVYGNYPDRAAAKAAVASLPRPLSELEPWARNLAQIQRDIRTYQP